MHELRRTGKLSTLTCNALLVQVPLIYNGSHFGHAHARTLPDQKAVVRAGADVVVHLVQGEKLDDEYLALLRQKKPYWATVISLGDPTAVCEHDPFFEQAMPATVIAKIRATMERRPLAPSCGPPSPNAATREAIIAYNFPRMVAAGARIVLGTDTGIEPGHTFGSGEHVEMARWVQLGLTPSQAVMAATQRPAELLGLKDMGTLAVGKRADFIVLEEGGRGAVNERLFPSILPPPSSARIRRTTGTTRIRLNKPCRINRTHACSRAGERRAA